MTSTFTFNGQNYKLGVNTTNGKITGLNVFDDQNCCLDEIPPQMDSQGILLPHLEQVNPDCMRIAKVAKNNFLYVTALLAIKKYLADNPEKPASGASVLSSIYRKIHRPDLALSETRTYRELDNAQALLNSRAAAMMDMVAKEPNNGALWIAKATNECERSLAYGVTKQLENVLMRLKSMTTHAKVI
jgi:hypothetical protein